MPGVAILSHGIGAAAFLVIAIFLSLHQPTRQKAPWVIIACLFTSLWSLLASLYAYKLIISYHWVVLSEVAQDGSWCYAVLRMLTTQSHTSFIFAKRKVLVSLLAAGLCLMAVNALLVQKQWLPGKESLFVQLDFMGHLALAVLGLSLVEQLYRGVKQHRRWGIKFFCLGTGALFGYDFVMYAHALLFKELDPNLWYTRGAISLLVAPFIILSAKRNQHWYADLVPSRVLVYRSTIIVGCGIYLVAMAVLGYALRAFGGHWGQALSILFLFGAALAMFALLFSGRARAYIKVFLARNVFKLYYDYREEWVRFSELLGQPNQDYSLSTRVIMAFAAMVESPEGILFEKDQIFKLQDTWNSEANIQNFSSPAHVAFFEQLDEPMLVEDLLQEGEIGAQIYHHLTGYERAWLIVPIARNHTVQAFVLLGKPRVNVTLNWEIKDLMTAASSQAAVFLQQKHLLEALQTAKQFESYHQISAFMLHDIKNLLSSTQLILQNKKHADNPKFKDTIFITLESIHNKLLKMQNQLHAPSQSWSNDTVDVKFELEKITAEYRLKQKLVRFNCALSAAVNIKIDLESFKHGIKHLVDNAIQASDYESAVQLTLSEQNGQVMIEVADNGIGMSQQFINQELFKPFASTKGQKGMGIGAFQVKTLVEKAKGTLEVTSLKGKGSTFTIRFPVYQKQREESEAVL